MSKIKIPITTVPYVYLDMSLFDGTIEEVSEKILNLRKRLENEHIRRSKELKYNEWTHPFSDYKYIYLNINTSYDEINVNLQVFRDETDAEYEERIQKEEEYKKAKLLKFAEKRKNTEQAERALLEELKKKYE